MNRFTLQATTFVNHPQGDKTFGYRIYDDHSQAYNNTLDKLPDDDLELLKIALESDITIVKDLLDFIKEHSKCIYIGDELYGWDQIKGLWEQ